MGYKNMIFDVMILNMESQLTELAHERFGKPLEKCGDEETYHILMLLTKRILRTGETNSGEKKVFYVSAEFLTGRLLINTLINLGIYDRTDEILRKYGKWFFLKPEALDRACEVFNRYGGATTFVCRLIPVIRQLISIPAGLARMPLGKFTLFTGLGAGIWTAILAGIGYALGRSAGDITWEYDNYDQTENCRHISIQSPSMNYSFSGSSGHLSHSPLRPTTHLLRVALS